MRKELRFAALIFIITLFAAVLCGCGTGTYTILLSEGTPPLTADNDMSIYTCDKGVSALEKISESGRISLYYDSESCSVCLYDSDTKMLWKSLPEKFNKKFSTLPSILELDIIANGRTYTVNSQNCCVKNGLAVCEKETGGLTVNYSFLIDADSKSVNITVPVKYLLKDGSLFVSIDCAAVGIESNTDVILREIRLMNYFGSSVKANRDDFMLVPDGCGAIILPYGISKDFEPVKLKVYGTDEADKTILPSAPIGAYGFKQKNSAAVAVIEEGEAVATVTANVAPVCGYNCTGAGFTVTASGEGRKKTGFSSDSYTGEIRLCFRFLSGNNSTYAAMASACREQIIRNGVLSPKSLTDSSNIPAVVSVIGASSLTGSSKIVPLTTYEQAQDMLALLKAKGFSNIYIRYCGLFEGGLNQTDISTFKMNSQLGNREELDELTAYACAQGHSIFYDIGILSSVKGGYSKAGTAKDIHSASLTVDGARKRSLLKLSRLEDKVLSVLGKAREYDFTGFCLNDAGNYLYSDYSSHQFNVRQAAMDEITSQTEPLVTGRKLMTATGNLFMLKNSCCAVNMPMAPSHETNDLYKAVPFLQMAVHGSMYYSGSPVNYQQDITDTALRCIEYGAAPAFEFCYADTDDYADAYYTRRATESAAAYSMINEALKGLGAQRITNHYEVQNNVFCTEYSDSTAIYVNYSDKDVIIDDTAVEPHSFIRIG
ncbi:MAG: DUF5696 domain-containing protein [Clostridia bacterium]|nr:DUF5696 domain-containing protein [Clostridia bacterium]